MVSSTSASELPVYETQPLLASTAAGATLSTKTTTTAVIGSSSARFRTSHAGSVLPQLSKPSAAAAATAVAAADVGTRDADGRRSSGSSDTPRSSSSNNSSTGPSSRTLLLVRCAVLVLLVGLSITAARYCTTDNLHLVVQFVQEDPASSLLLFFVIYSAGVVLMVPGMMLTIAAGAAYGFVTGSLLSWFSSVVGQTGAFVLGRYLLREMVAGFLARKFPNFSTIDNNISQQGWKLVLLLRLSPFIPYMVLNYGLGITSVGLWTYCWVSALAALPFALAFAYLGAASNDLYDALQGHETTRAGLDWTIAMAGIMLLSAALLGWACQRLLFQGTNDPTSSSSNPGSSCSVGTNVSYHKAPSEAPGDIQMEVLTSSNPANSNSSSSSSSSSSRGCPDPLRAQSPAVLFHQASVPNEALESSRAVAS